MFCRFNGLAWIVLAGMAAVQNPSQLQAQVPDTESMLSVQRERMKSLDQMDGTWRGSAWIILPSGQKQELTQTERVGPFLDGAVKVVEGRGYDESRKVVFNALGVISYDVQKQQYQMQSHAQGRAGDFVLELADGGYSWEIPAGSMTIRYSATIKDGKWNEYGDRIVDGREPIRFFEMTLVRVADTDWPASGAVLPLPEFPRLEALALDPGSLPENCWAQEIPDAPELKGLKNLETTSNPNHFLVADERLADLIDVNTINAAWFAIYKERNDIGFVAWEFSSVDAAARARDALVTSYSEEEDRIKIFQSGQIAVMLYRDPGTTDECFEFFKKHLRKKLEQ